MYKLINKENPIAQVEVNPNLPETQKPLIPVPGDSGIYGVTCFAIAMCVFYKILK